MVLTASSLNSSKGVSKSKSCNLPMAASCVKIQLPFASPIGAIAPFLMESFFFDWEQFS